MVGERTNITGSRKFARLIREEKFDEAVNVAREQVQGGANILDVNMDEGLIDGPKAMTRFLNLVASEPDLAEVPIMVDSSNFAIIEAGLKCIQGKSIVNSISLKEGEAKSSSNRPDSSGVTARRSVVMAFVDDGVIPGMPKGQAVARRPQGRASAKRAYKILTKEIGFKPRATSSSTSNILTVGTGMEEHNNYAVEFIDAVRELKRRLPRLRRPRAA